MTLSALAINCTLKSGDEESSTHRLIGEVMAQLGKHEVAGEVIRAADRDIRPG